MDPIFIVGCPRSGTTLLSVLLDRHSQIAITPETAFYDEIAPQLGASADLTTILNRWSRLPELRLTPSEILDTCGDQAPAAQLMRAILELYAQKRQKPCAGEKTPQHLRHVPTILADFPNARILCLVRDGRDVALSLRSMPWGPVSLADCATMWLVANREIEDFSSRFEPNIRVVRFEHLVAEPDVILSQVMDFLHLTFERQQLHPGRSEVVLERSLAWKGAALEAVDPLSVGRRRKDYPEELIYLQNLLEADLRRLKYLP